jgi:hypothetical protein
MFKSYLNKPNLSRGLRNNNPGNLVKTSIAWHGKVPHSQNKDTRFEQFVELRYGIRAKMRDVINDIFKGKNTVTKLINEFAPAFENNTVAYITNVANALGILPTAVITTISEEFLIDLCKAISKVENGSQMDGFITDQDYFDAIAILGKTQIPVVDSKKKIR